MYQYLILTLIGYNCKNKQKNAIRNATLGYSFIIKNNNQRIWKMFNFFYQLLSYFVCCQIEKSQKSELLK